MPSAIYVRLSQNRSEDIDKPQRQKDACSKWLEDGGVKTYEVYEDDDVSAYRGKHRPSWERLKADIQAGLVTQVVALHMDRLLRSMKELEALIDLVEATNVKINTIESGEIDLTTS